MKAETEFQTIPIMRIFDVAKAKQFYLGFLGMKIDWEHRFESEAPVYMQVSRGDLVLHLSEHSGDCTPGAKVLVYVNQIERLHQDVTSKGYKYKRPTIEMSAWGDRIFEVVDPFCNKILFDERKSA